MSVYVDSPIWPYDAAFAKQKEAMKAFTAWLYSFDCRLTILYRRMEELRNL